MTNKTRPTISIVTVISEGVESMDRWKVFSSCFDSLINQSYPKDRYELIVVNSGADYPQERLDDLRSKAKHAAVPFYYLDPKQGNVGASRSRNYGARMVSDGATSHKSDIIMFTDDDTLPPRDWAERLSEPFVNNEDIIGSGGLYLPPKELAEKNMFAYYDIVIYKSYFNHPTKDGFSLYEQLPEGYTTRSVGVHPEFTGSIAYRLDAFNSVGGFDESIHIYGEDSDLKKRMLQKHKDGLFAFVPVMSVHLAHYNARRFKRQQEGRGRSILEYNKRHGLRKQSRPEIIARLLAAPVVFLKTLLDRRGLKDAYLETYAYIFRQIGKLKFYNNVYDR